MVGLHATRGLQLHDEERVRKHYRIRQSRYRDVASSGCVVREVELTEITGVCLLERRSDSHAVPEVDPNPSLAALLLAPVVKPLLLIGRENTWHTQCPRCHGESLLRGLLDDLLEGTTDLGLLALPPVREELGLPDDDVGIEVTHIGVDTPVATARERNLRCLRYAKDHKIRDETLEACPRCCIVTAVRPESMPDGLLDTAAIQAVQAGGGDQRSERTVDGRTYALLTTSDGDHDRVIQVAIDQHETAEELTRLSVALLVGGVVAVVLSFATSYLMAKRSMRPLADALALQRRFVADASHELRTPLTLLSTRAQLLKRRGQDGLPDDVTDAIEEVVTDANALTEILDDLLLAADPRSSATQEPVDLVAVADQAIALLADDATARHIALTRTGEPGAVTVTGSPAALLRLLIALCTNALDHAHSTVSVAVTVTSSRAVLTVTDDGPGFDPAIAATAFERFSSSRAGTRPGAPGDGTRHYGLGLAIVSEIARRHNGTVSIEQSHPGGTVMCSFPVASSAR